MKKIFFLLLTITLASCTKSKPIKYKDANFEIELQKLSSFYIGDHTNNFKNHPLIDIDAERISIKGLLNGLIDNNTIEIERNKTVDENYSVAIKQLQETENAKEKLVEQLIILLNYDKKTSTKQVSELYVKDSLLFNKAKVESKSKGTQISATIHTTEMKNATLETLAATLSNSYSEKLIATQNNATFNLTFDNTNYTNAIEDIEQKLGVSTRPSNKKVLVYTLESKKYTTISN